MGIGHDASPACAHDRTRRRLGERWFSLDRQPLFLLPVLVLSRLFRRLFLTALAEAHRAGRLNFFGAHASLADASAFAAFLKPLRKIGWVVYAKEPFAGPEPVLRYLARYTHRVAISNRRLVSATSDGVAFRWKVYRTDTVDRWQTMTLHPYEFIRRFLMHVLPKGFHRIRHYGLFANGNRVANVARVRELLAVTPPASPAPPSVEAIRERPCPCCGRPMRVIEVFARGAQPRSTLSNAPAIRIDTS